MRDDRVYIRHIAERIDLVGRYLTGAEGDLDEHLFYDDLRTQDAVLRRMETLADAASHLAAESVDRRGRMMRWNAHWMIRRRYEALPSRGSRG